MKTRMLLVLLAFAACLGVGCRLGSEARKTSASHAAPPGPAVPFSPGPGSERPATTVAAAEPQPGEEMGQGGPSAAPSERHCFDLTKLQKFYFDKTMTSQQRLDGLVKYLKEEMADPSYPGIGPGGGPIDTGYIQRMMIWALGQTVDAADLAKARKATEDSALHQRFTVALGRAGDRSLVRDLCEMVVKDPRGFMREAAASSLRELKDPSSSHALRAALADRYSGIGISDVGPGPHITKMYLVREAAAGALRALGEKVEGVVTEVPLEVGSIPEALSRLFEDEQPDVCLSTVQLLDCFGAEGLPYIRAFLNENEGDETLKEAVEEARRILEAAKNRDDSAPAPSAPPAHANQ